MNAIDEALADPIVVGALRRHGLTPETASRKENFETGCKEVSIHATRDHPSVYVNDEGRVVINWSRDMRQVATYTVDPDMSIMTIISHETPDTMMTAMIGTLLSETIDVEGADAMRVEQVVNSRRTSFDEYDTRIQVARSAGCAG